MSVARKANDQAAEWLMRQEEADWSSSDQAALDAWLQASEGHKAAYWRLKHIWHKADRMRALRPVTLSPRSSHRRYDVAWKQAAAAAACLALVGTLFAFTIYRQAPASRETMATMRFETPVGGHREIRLPDGSVIDLNTESELHVAFSPGRREVRLDQGEAYFQVAHIPTRPFVVISGDQSVTVLGTRFAVRHEATGTTVSVISGRVRLAAAAKSEDGPLAVLGRGDIAVAAGGSTLVTSKSVREVENTLSWRTGTLTFDDAPLETACAEFNRYNRKQIVIADARLAAMRIGGAFPAADPDAFARLLRDAYGLKVQFGRDIVKVSP